ncbi:MAG: hypothetical protein K2M45_08175 [Muribaculaceae bacterium]|nr:hypothetical protein [Muribaculaceae bacterium]
MYDSALDACRLDLYSPEDILREKYPALLVEKVIRIRAMHQWILANPAAKDALFISEDVHRHNISRPTAYSDLAVIKALLPSLETASREFHRWRFNEMLLKTFEMAELRKDARTMERASATYAKFNAIDREEERSIPIEKIIPQPFVATDDPSILGIKPIPNLRERQRKLIEKYRKETVDIEDISFEEVDLLEQELFPQ